MADKKDDQPVLMTLNTLSSRMSVPKSRSLPPMGHHCAHCVKTVNDVSLLVIVPLKFG